MTEKLHVLYRQWNRPIIGRILRQFGDFNVDVPVTLNMNDSQLFNTLTKNRGKGKPHSEKGLTRKAGKVRNS